MRITTMLGTLLAIATLTSANRNPVQCNLPNLPFAHAPVGFPLVTYDPEAWLFYCDGQSFFLQVDACRRACADFEKYVPYWWA